MRAVLVFTATTSLIVAFANTTAFCQTLPVGMVQTSQNDMLKILTSNSNNVDREDAAYSFANGRQAIIQQMMRVLTGRDSSSDQKGCAAIVLGEYRAQEAVPFLALHLTELDAPTNRPSGFIVTGSTEGIPIQDRASRAAAALKKIGLASIPPLLSRIADSDDADLTRKCVAICIAIEEPEIIEFRIQKLIDKETDAKRKGRLEATLKTLKKPLSTDGHK